jgi:threonylcarbamoyladenosine tRNA methylthiotransferase MtaB
MKVYFYTLGCKVNQYETQEMSELLEKNGYTIIYNAADADVAVVNSCTVTAESVRKTRQIIRKLKKQNSDNIIILTGCASQAEPQIINDLPEVDIFMGNRSNAQIVEALNEFLANRIKITKRIEHLTGDAFCGTGVTRFDGHTRAFLKIQDGCDRFCSYCLIPTARGRSRSKSIEDIDAELKVLSENGYSEIVFVGINLSDYGKNTPYSLPDALRLAEKYNGIKRVRLGSLEPDHITDEMIEQFKSITKLCPQFHISVQSGCNNVLKAMNRHYTAEEFKEKVDLLREVFDNPAITTDVIVGFPGETEEEFEATYKFLEDICFYEMHVFKYSKRQGTVAAARKDQVDDRLKTERSNRLLEMEQMQSSQYRKSYI